jgi:hypothetical protein
MFLRLIKKSKRRFVPIRKIILGSIFATLILFSCKNPIDIETKLPANLKVKVNNSSIVYLNLINNSTDEIIINKFTTSCNCNTLNNSYLKLKPNSSDSVAIVINAPELGKQKERIIFTYNNQYKKIDLNYEVIE